MKSRKLYRLRTVLLLVTISILLLPIASILYFRFYENELVRQTEIELIAQSAVIAATYRSLIKQAVPNNGTYGKLVASSLHNGHDDYYTPVTPTLDLSKDKVRGRRTNANPVYDPPDNAAIATGKQLQQILKDTQQVMLAGMRVLDFNGIVIAGQNERGFSLAHIYEVKLALEGQYKSVIRERVTDDAPPPIASISRGTGIRVFTAFPILDNKQLYGVVYLSRTPQNILKHLYAVTGRVLVATTVVLGIALFLAFFVAARVVHPIKQLTRQAHKLARGETNTVESLDKPGTYEVANLSESLATMSQTLHQRNDYIRQFAAHVSHEFKTPLTSIQGAIELLQDHIDEMPAEQRKRFLDNLQSDTQRLEKLVNRLLELAKADAMQASNDLCDLNLVLKQLQKRYAEKGLDIQITTTHLANDVLIAADVLETIFTNLFENSLQHEADKITIDAQRRENSVQITLQDNGTGVSASNAERIFTPFFTTRRDAGGTGLGLDIVTSLLRTWNGDISLKRVDTGAAFTISLLSAD